MPNDFSNLDPSRCPLLKTAGGLIEQFNHVDPSASGLHRRADRLIAAERFSQGDLAQTCRFTPHDQQFDEPLLARRAKGLWHSPESTENEGRQVQ